MYLKSTSIKNIQSHKHSIIHWHPGVNVIVGSTDTGKSVIFRAIGWVIKNRIEDRGFRSKWGGKADVELTFTDKKEVSRVQDKDNAYYLFDPVANKDEEYKAFRTDVPEDIIEALNMGDINIQSQFDPPFLLADSPSDVAKTLNKIANLSDIDISISNIRKWVLANSREINTVESQIADLEEQTKSFGYLEQMEKDVVAWEELESDFIQHKHIIFGLETIIESINKDQNELTEIEAFLKAEVPLQAALALTETLQAVTAQITGLEALLTTIETNTKTQNELETFLEAESELKRVLFLIDELCCIQRDEISLQDMINSILTIEGKIRTLGKNIDGWQMEFDACMGNTCPLCERSL